MSTQELKPHEHLDGSRLMWLHNIEQYVPHWKIPDQQVEKRLCVAVTKHLSPRQFVIAPSWHQVQPKWMIVWSQEANPSDKNLFGGPWCAIALYSHDHTCQSLILGTSPVSQSRWLQAMVSGQSNLMRKSLLWKMQTWWYKKRVHFWLRTINIHLSGGIVTSGSWWYIQVEIHHPRGRLKLHQVGLTKTEESTSHTEEAELEEFQPPNIRSPPIHSGNKDKSNASLMQGHKSWIGVVDSRPDGSSSRDGERSVFELEQSYQRPRSTTRLTEEEHFNTPPPEETLAPTAQSWEQEHEELCWGIFWNQRI